MARPQSPAVYQWALLTNQERFTHGRRSNKIDDLAGKAKEGVGRAGDKSTENEGKLDQAKSSLKDAGGKVKDAFKK
jgi:uncharacterized protein YjbJ (UPF0337 family)